MSAVCFGGGGEPCEEQYCRESERSGRCPRIEGVTGENLEEEIEEIEEDDGRGDVWRASRAAGARNAAEACRGDSMARLIFNWHKIRTIRRGGGRYKKGCTFSDVELSDVQQLSGHRPTPS